MAARTISILATVILVVAAVALVLRRAILGDWPFTLCLQAVGLALVLWARITFGLRSFHFAANPTAGRLVTNGPYHYVRNPIYAGAWLFVWSGVASHWSPMNAMLAGIVALTLLVRLACEEQLLRRTYPEYEDYAHKTARLIPFIV
jgi:protein-S-isoprenylcysteine O-methyltransferase Ste14